MEAAGVHVYLSSDRQTHWGSIRIGTWICTHVVFDARLPSDTVALDPFSKYERRTDDPCQTSDADDGDMAMHGEARKTNR